MKTGLLATALLLCASSAFATDFEGKWTVTGTECFQGKDVYAMGDDNVLLFDGNDLVAYEWEADIKKVVKTGKKYTIFLHQPESDMNGAARSLTLHASLSKDGETAKIDGKTYTRCK